MVFLPFLRHLSAGLLFWGLCAALVPCAHAASEDDALATSPKKPWGEFTVVEEPEADGSAEQSSGPAWWSQALMWIPNRVLDFFDVFRVDAGVGPAVGAVVRLSRYGQAGYRDMAPFSLRIGDFGRKAPIMVETSSEFGIGPGYINSADRKVCKGEVGAGLDVLLVGGYVGFCSEELLDFLAGIFFIDIMDDDIKAR